MLKTEEGYRVEIVDGGYMFFKDIKQNQIIDDRRSGFLNSVRVKDNKDNNNSKITNNYKNYNNYQSAKGYQDWSR